ncbi:MAG TPA: PhzF family phenazine biosynthesis protein [Candidatus Binatia bacterium]|nr:PhzF family phenazine biosynthesis protein [Candidatus Binatia bacterium]
MTQRKFRFVQLDVFTARPLEGNQLAVFTDARGLSDAEMQRLARETNLCETTFILPREEATEGAEGHRVRIFTVSEELPFAGHPTLGTAWYLKQHSSDDEIVLDLKVGKIPVRFQPRDGLLFGEMRQAEPQFGATHPHDTIAGVLGLPVAELDDSLPIQTVSTGMPFTIVPFRSLATLQKLTIGWNQMAPFLATIGNPAFFYFVCRQTADPRATLHARMIFYNGEDPATGSAAGCCAAWAVKYGVLAPEEQGMIEQGIETRRPSSIYIRAAKSADAIANVRVGGNVVQVIDGEVTM